jgi:hypothetical protein
VAVSRLHHDGHNHHCGAGAVRSSCCLRSVVVATPMLIAGLAVRRHLVTGLSLGAVTGE